MSSGYISVFPSRDSIVDKYKPKYEREKNIEYIRSQLVNIRPDVLADFEYFVDKINAFKTNKSSYQDLIGSRSMFFYKLIFTFTMNTYGCDKPRREAIRKFVFGSNTYDTKADPIIKWP